MKTTPVEWLGLQLNMLFTGITEEQWDKAEKLFQQAKEMEKQNMINFLKSVFQQDGFDYEKAFEQFKNK